MNIADEIKKKKLRERVPFLVVEKNFPSAMVKEMKGREG